MTVTLHNYEELYIDYIDGMLEPEAIEALRAFAVLHPELDLDMQLDALPHLVETSIAFPDKSALKRIDDDEWAVIEALENGSTASLTSPDQLAALAQYERTLLQADERITFEDKASLKQKEEGIIIPLWVKRIAIAASLIGAILVLIPNKKDQQYDARTAAAVIDIYEDIRMPDLQIKPEPLIAKIESSEEAILLYEAPEINLAARQNSKKEKSPQIDIEQAQLAAIEVADTLESTEQRAMEEIEGGIAQEQPLQVEDTSQDLVIDDLEDEVALVEEAGATIETHSIPTPLTQNSNTASTGESRTIKSALDLLKKVTADSEVFALQDAETDAQYTETTMKVKGFEFAIKRRKKKS